MDGLMPYWLWLTLTGLSYGFAIAMTIIGFMCAPA
jgi:hypothetical protein